MSVGGMSRGNFPTLDGTGITVGGDNDVAGGGGVGSSTHCVAISLRMST